MKSKALILVVLCALVVCLCPAGMADEGMWLFNAFPSAKVKAEYGFAATQQWLDHVRLSSVRFNNGGSGSFVSADGLVFTNHHVGAQCIQELSKAGTDYMKQGFYARTRADEAKCPNLELNVLEGIADVSKQVQAAATPGMTPAQAGAAQRAEMAQLEKDCNAKTGLRCDVVTLYSGGMYHLYRYKKYTDVRLVFAPEFDAAFFGGDPDNFTYPRYDLDITFFRIYENNKPVHLSDYFRWSPTGVKDNELVFVSGNPGSTGRWLTASQLEFLRATEYPFRLSTLRRRIDYLKDFSSESAENARIAHEDIFGLENSFKAITGYNKGLTPELIAKKQSEEAALKRTAAGNQKENVGDPWAAIAKAMDTEREIWLPLNYVEGRPAGSSPATPSAFRADLADYARQLVRLAAERRKPNPERLREYRESAIPSLLQDLFSTAPIYKALETAIVTESLQEMQDAISKSNADIVQRILAGKTPAQRAEELISGTKLDDVAFRKQLYEGGEQAIQKSTDPLIVLMREIDPAARNLRKTYDDQVDAVERTEGAKIARLKFAQGGLSIPPDATFTLRLSYGTAKGYEENGKPIPYFTTMGGALQYAAAHGDKPPYQLPQSWMSHRQGLNLQTPLNFVSTPDIIGGNSGSPVVNQNAEVVGIIFDGNIQSLGWRFQYEDKIGRAVSVDSRGIQEALRKIYGAIPLADELTSGKMAAPAVAAATSK